MVDPRVCPPKADVELADVVRRFGPQYSWGDGSTAATTATTRSGATTAAGTGRAPNAMEARPGSGSKSVKPSCCRVTIFTPS